MSSPIYNALEASNPETSMLAYDLFSNDQNQHLDTTERNCTLCGHKSGGFDLVVHTHFVHSLDYSDICPCESCVLHNVTSSLGPSWEAASRRKMTQASSLPVTEKTPPRSWAESMVSRPVFVRNHASKNDAAWLPEDHIDLTATDDYTGSESANAPEITVERPNPSTPATPPVTWEAYLDTLRNPTNNTIDIRKRRDSQQPSPPTSEIGSISISPPKPKLPTPIVKIKRTQPANGAPLPNEILFYPGSDQISEKNLPYEMSLIEYGELRQAPGGVTWFSRSTETPRWLDGNDKQVPSQVTGKPMSWIPADIMPLRDISRDAPGWQLLHYIRKGVSQGYQVKQQDIFDRMPNPLTGSGLTNRIQTWSRSVGILAQQTPVIYNWPSKQAMETVAQLSYIQLNFNTWWDVQLLPSQNPDGKAAYIIRQPSEHEGYRDHVVDPKKRPANNTKAPYYELKNPEHRQMSEQVKLLDDALLFLTIKAEESDMPQGFHGIMNWLTQPAGDSWTENLDIDLVCEFERWREGCPETPTLDALRAALDFAESAAETEAIKNADYSLTPWLQNVVDGLAPKRAERRKRDGRIRAEITTRTANRKNKKRKAGEVGDSSRDGAGGSSKRVCS